MQNNDDRSNEHAEPPTVAGVYFIVRCGMTGKPVVGKDCYAHWNGSDWSALSHQVDENWGPRSWRMGPGRWVWTHLVKADLVADAP